MSGGLFKRLFGYNGSLEFKAVNDEIVNAGYQHKYVVEKYLAHIKDKKILDAGCWTGSFEKAIVEKKITTDLVGLDENESALEVARKNFPEFKFFKGGLMEPRERIFSQYQGYFDTVVFLDVIEHLPINCEVNVLRLLRSLIKDAGVIILSTMSDHCCNFIDPAWFCGHRHYKLKDIRKILSDSGFRVIDEAQIGNLYWDIDLLWFYIYKHIFKKKYSTCKHIQNKILQGFNHPKMPTRLYILAGKA